jgi:hypothetical protein
MNAGTLSALQSCEKHFTAPEERQTHRSCLVHLHPCNACGPWAVVVLTISWLGGSAVLTRYAPLPDGSPIRRRISDPELSAGVSAKQVSTDQLTGGGARARTSGAVPGKHREALGRPMVEPGFASYRSLRPKHRPSSAMAALHASSGWSISTVRQTAYRNLQ